MSTIPLDSYRQLPSDFTRFAGFFITGNIQPPELLVGCRLAGIEPPRKHGSAQRQGERAEVTGGRMGAGLSNEAAGSPGSNESGQSTSTLVQYGIWGWFNEYGGPDFGCPETTVDGLVIARSGHIERLAIDRALHFCRA